MSPPAPQADAGDSRPLRYRISISKVTMQDAQPPQQCRRRQRRGGSRTGPRAAEERGPDLRQRRHPEGARHGGAAAAGGGGLPAEVIEQSEGDAARFRQLAVSTPRRRRSRATGCTSRRWSRSSPTPPRSSSTSGPAATWCTAARPDHADERRAARRGRQDRAAGSAGAVHGALARRLPFTRPEPANEAHRRMVLVGTVVALIIASLSLFVVDQRQNAMVFRLARWWVETKPGSISRCRSSTTCVTSTSAS